MVVVEATVQWWAFFDAWKATASQYGRVEVVTASPLTRSSLVLPRFLNRIRTCMETGALLVLVGMQAVYSSLLDVLNRSYLQVGCCAYARLAIGGHSEYYRVHPRFKLVVVEDTNAANSHLMLAFGTRLEKRVLNFSTISRFLNTQYAPLLRDTDDWIKSRFSTTLRSDDQHLKQLFFGCWPYYLPSLIASLGDTVRLSDVVRRLQWLLWPTAAVQNKFPTCSLSEVLIRALQIHLPW